MLCNIISKTHNCTNLVNKFQRFCFVHQTAKQVQVLKIFYLLFCDKYFHFSRAV